MIGWNRGTNLTTWVVGFAVACGGTVTSHGAPDGTRGAGGTEGLIGPKDGLPVGNPFAPDASAGFGGSRPSYGGASNYGGSGVGYGGTRAGGASNFGGYAGAEGGVNGVGGAAGSSGTNAGGASADLYYPCVPTNQVDPGGTEPLGSTCAYWSTLPPFAMNAAGTCAAPEGAAASPMSLLLGHGNCAPPLVCAPLPTDGGAPAWATCGLLANREGRCIPKAFAMVPAMTMRLSESPDCPSQIDMWCVPCYDPIDGTDTHACTIGNDRPTTPPAPLRSCGAYDGGPALGVCVPDTTALSWNDWVLYHQDDCPTGDWCVPRTSARLPGTCFSHCTTTQGKYGAEFSPGACVPSYVARDMNPSVPGLERGACGSDELCAPCLNPMNLGTRTGFCY